MGNITVNSKIVSDIAERPVELALESLRRDMQKTLLPSEEAGLPLVLARDAALGAEMWRLALVKRAAGAGQENACGMEAGENAGESARLCGCTVGADDAAKEHTRRRAGQAQNEKDEALLLTANSALGFVYGIYELSRRFLGVEPFWFWNDQVFEPRASAAVPEGFKAQSEPFRVKLRGWFVNDEVLIHTWKVDGDKDEPWRMVFEALLRLGGNMTIPGTDKNSKRYRRLASDMGLYITHHHAEPLGAEMFARAYPELQASYAAHGDLYRGLWAQALEEQKDMNVVWNLGFRGQGDRPFWDDDPAYDTDEKRGALMGELIGIQYRMVKERHPDALCCTNLYGETMELYKKGCLKLPEDVIYIWADNGFGKMVSRRQGNHNPRVAALPEPGVGGRHGIYYHASFYDLQAANHMTMLPNTVDFVERELQRVLAHGADDYWIINCSNVKPHVFTLAYIAQLWRSGDLRVSGEDGVGVSQAVQEQGLGAAKQLEAEQRAQKAGQSAEGGRADRSGEIRLWAEDYAKRYFGEAQAAELAQRFLAFAEHAVQYGPNEDDHAGEQFVNHVPRMLMAQFMEDRSRSAQELLWACRAETLKEQLRWYQPLCEEGVRSWTEYLRACEETGLKLGVVARRLFEDSLLLQARILLRCYTGALEVCRSLACGFEGDYKRAFYHAGQASDAFYAADEAMRSREHGKWHEFYRNECLADMKQSGWVAKQLMGYLRTLGDGPHYYRWQQEFLHSEADRRVMLILNMENHLTDREIYALMKARWED